MIRYIIDSSALWRLRRDRDLLGVWMEEITLRLIGSCPPQRVEFLRSASNAEEYECWRDDLVKLFPEIPLPKRIWSWVDTVQHQLAGQGVLGSVSPVDLMICATAAHHGVTILHDDKDFRTVARFVPGVVELSINSRKRGKP
ncbi:PIN domain-containing protein [Nocardia goodfellowii]|uniref:Ribonuclease VapC n=1 Tax=Nocardia goodfellowii TaxID=882446 RepID=A0ABS4QPQ5_9NOCA|nr:PIN domain-containing protein [Nocardia goodfellowii]MBP2193702.1 putative nucleic acid-binding protein [Nocardia goodfellowii]